MFIFSDDTVTMKSFMLITQNSNSPVKSALTAWPFSDEVPYERQSPVAIINSLVTDVVLPTLQFYNHVDDDVDCKVENNGHTGK